MERHPLDLISLGFGVLFALTGLAFLLGDVPLLRVVQLRWLVPLLVLVLGLWLLASSAVSSRRVEGDGGEAPEPER